MSLCVSTAAHTVLFTSDHHYGRAVIMFGVPYVYTESRILKLSIVCVAMVTIQLSCTQWFYISIFHMSRLIRNCFNFCYNSVSVMLQLCCNATMAVTHKSVVCNIISFCKQKYVINVFLW